MENSTSPEYAPTCWIQRLVQFRIPGTGRREAGGVWHVAGGGKLVGGSRNHDVGLYHHLKLIGSTPTETKSHDASQPLY